MACPSTDTQLPVERVEQSDEHTRIDQLEQVMLSSGCPVELPLTHRFTDGMYVREIFMPAGTLVTSKIHKTQHPYVVLRGRVSVLIPGEGVQHLLAGHMGITQPGTRRVLYVHEDTVWVTFHRNPTNTRDLDEIEDDLIEQRVLEGSRTAFQEYMELLSEASNGNVLRFAESLEARPGGATSLG